MFIVDTGGAMRYNLPIISQEVVESGGVEKCFMGSTNIALTAKDASSFPPSLEKSLKKIMWSVFLLLAALIHAFLYLQRMNGGSKKPGSNRYHSRIAKLGSLIGFIFPELVRLTAINREEF